jgi:hypothetical protein
MFGVDRGHRPVSGGLALAVPNEIPQGPRAAPSAPSAGHGSERSIMAGTAGSGSDTIRGEAANHPAHLT